MISLELVRQMDLAQFEAWFRDWVFESNDLPVLYNDIKQIAISLSALVKDAVFPLSDTQLSERYNILGLMGVHSNIWTKVPDPNYQAAVKTINDTLSAFMSDDLVKSREYYNSIVSAVTNLVSAAKDVATSALTSSVTSTLKIASWLDKYKYHILAGTSCIVIYKILK